MQLKRSAPALALLAPVASAFYLPGVAPTSYKKDDLVPLYVNTIKPVAASSDAPLKSVVSFDYYHPFFGFCHPVGGPQDVRESLGGVLFGDRIKTSPFELKMKHNESCKSLCEHTYNPASASFVNEAIQNGVTLNWLVDGLPAGQRAIDQATGNPYYNPGFFVGQEMPDGKVEFNNHYDIFVEYHEVSGDPNQLRVVGVLVEPSSLKHSEGKLTPESCERSLPGVVLDEAVDTKVRFTYSVFWLPSKTTWATRMDPYFFPYNANIQWFSLVNSAIVVIFLVLTVMSVLVRALKRDIARYNRLDQINLDDLSGTSALEDGVQEDSGWKLVHGDVFRTPSHPLLLSVLLGGGAQIFVVAGFTLCFALLGFISPSNRGALGSIMVILYAFLAIIAGYTSARVYKTLQGDKWKLNIILTPLFVPGIVFAVFFLLNLFLWARGSSGAVPFSTMLVIILIWFIISVPLSFAGSWLGFRAAAVEPPVRTNQIPRQIPPSTTYLKPIPSMLLVGILPFGAIFVELHFVMNSIWSNRIFFMFGFLFLCYGLMIITSAAVTVLMVYFLLCSENYNWQWRSFLASGTCGVYIFLNALIYWVSNMSLSTLSGNVLYMGYSLLISFLFFVLTGSIGYFASWWFVQKIYSSIKID